jgi:hypothetical protein
MTDDQHFPSSLTYLFPTFPCVLRVIQNVDVNIIVARCIQLRNLYQYLKDVSAVHIPLISYVLQSRNAGTRKAE